MKKILSASLLSMLAVSATAAELRPLNTDRPDKTEAPQTVDKGHFQFETDLVSVILDEKDDEGIKRREILVNFANFKYGVSHAMDVQVLAQTYNFQRTNDNGTVAEQNGYGDTTLRLKYNILGNDEGRFQLGTLAFMTLPTAQDGMSTNRVEGGIMLPASYHLGSDFWLSGMLQYGRQALSEAETGTAHAFVTTLSFAFPLFGSLSGYTELFSQIDSDAHSGWQATFDTGLLYMIGENVQLDVGVNLGLTEAADDYNPFLGLSFRI